MIKKILLFSLMLLIFGCAEYKNNQLLKKENKIYFSSTGFALIYDDSIYKNKIINKKIDNDKLVLLHKTLKRNTNVKITNLKNSKSLELKVYKNAKYPSIFNSVISQKVASLLELNDENPFVEIVELKKNKKFIAKEGNTFEEEKNVADKAPVDEIEMDTLNTTNVAENKKGKKNEKYIIIISDFYYMDSAKSLKDDLINKTSLGNISIKKINDNKYRLLVGPFENFNALKTSYISLNKLGFEDLNIYNE